jgi:hypothetical protein
MSIIICCMFSYYLMRVIKHQYEMHKHIKQYNNKFKLHCITLIMGICWPLTAVYLLLKK